MTSAEVSPPKAHSAAEHSMARGKAIDSVAVTSPFRALPPSAGSSATANRPAVRATSLLIAEATPTRSTGAAVDMTSWVLDAQTETFSSQNIVS